MERKNLDNAWNAIVVQQEYLRTNHSKQIALGEAKNSKNGTNQTINFQYELAKNETEAANTREIKMIKEFGLVLEKLKRTQNQLFVSNMTSEKSLKKYD